ERPPGSKHRDGALPTGFSTKRNAFEKSALLRLKTYYESVEFLLSLQLIAQTIGLRPLDQRPYKYPIHPVGSAYIGVIALRPQCFLQLFGVLKTGEAGQLHGPTDR